MKAEKLSEIEIEARRRIAGALLKKANLPLMFIAGSPIYAGTLNPEIYGENFPGQKDACLAYLFLRTQPIDKGLPELIGEICLREESKQACAKSEDYPGAIQSRNTLEGLYAKLAKIAEETSNNFRKVREKGN